MSDITQIQSQQNDITKDLEHINQEMLKKNIELAERNKTLTLFRRIDDIIFSSVNDPVEIATQVAKILVAEADFLFASILVIDKQKQMLVRFGIAESTNIEASRERLKNYAQTGDAISLAKKENAIVQVVSEGRYKSTNNLRDVTLHNLSDEEANKLQQLSQIKTYLIFPLRVRDETLGAIVVGHQATEKELTEYQMDLIGRLVGVVGIVMDHALLYQELQKSNQKLQELDQLKDEFVSLASHELRTPMTAIKSYLWMALAGRGGPLTDKQMYYLNRAYTSVDRLIKLVGDMLNISRIESGRISLALQSTALSNLILEVVDELKPRIEQAGLTLSFNFPREIPSVIADPERIKEVLNNLLDNAIKFTPVGGKITITLSYSPKDQKVDTVISDTGSGIPQDEIPRLFQKFGFLHGSYTVNKSATQGTGLGLYICKSIIQLHGGKIWIHSDGLGKGTSVTFSLPISKN
jgi:signal transduction histidine kinase